MQQQTSLSEKILLLRGMEIFKDLPVGALAAIASLTEEEEFSPRELYDHPGRRHGGHPVFDRLR